MELVQLSDGRPGAAVFTTVQALVQQLGPHQPWMMIETSRLRAIAARVVGTILLDPAPGVLASVWTSDRLAQLAEAFDG